MMHLNTLIKISLVILSLLNFNDYAMGQEKSSYEMTLVKVIDNEAQKEVVVILKVSPTIDNFKLIISGRVEYAFGRKTIQTDIQKDSNTQIIVYGDDISSKAPEMYALIKEDIEIKEGEYVLVFRFSNIKGKNLAEGYFKYGLWESNNSEIRNEQIFPFNEKVIIKN